MFKTTFGALALIGAVDASSTADENFTNTLQSCQDFAGSFENTCSSAGSLSSMPSASVTCADVGACAGTESGSNCTWQRKLCVTCRMDSGFVKIRVQTNGLPSHCYASPQTAPAEQTVDWEVLWLSYANSNSDSGPITQDALNSLMCDDLAIAKDSKIPSSAGYSKLDGGEQKTAFGVATTGVLMFSAMSAEKVDPFYPAVYAEVTDPAAVVEKVDWCLAHPQNQGVFHYHAPSTCQANPAAYMNQKGKMNQDIKTLMQDAWKAVPYRTPLGVSKDGRPILTPYHGNGQAYTDCEVDVCNGLKINGHYMYATTFFHPYLMGCYGIGSAPRMYQQCSTNPRLCGVEYVDATMDADGAMAKSVPLLVAGATAVFATLF